MAPMQQVSTAQALWRGFTMRCPNCGSGKLFGRFLKVVDHCSVCGEEFSHHRADDFPAYVVILIVGHTVLPALLAVDSDYAPPMWLEFLIWLPLTIASALALLQPTKGAIVGLQWQLGMHGFATSKLRGRAASALTPHSIHQKRALGVSTLSASCHSTRSDALRNERSKRTGAKSMSH